MEKSSRMKNVKMSGIRKMFEMAGDDALHLGLGEPDFQPPDHVIEALYNAAREGHNKYASTFGIMPLREAIAESYGRYRKDLTSDNVLVTASATEALFATMQTFISPGDEVITPNPGFVLYDSQIRLAGGTPVHYALRKERSFLPDIEEISSLITDRTRAIIINSPCNPTGGVMDGGMIKAIAELADENGLLLISDEVYDRIVYDKDHHSSLEYTDNTVVINSFSKTLALTGWRLGYLVSPSSDIIKDISVAHYYVIACPPTPTQYAALAAYENKDETERFLSTMLKAFRYRRDLITKLTNSIDGLSAETPSGAFYLFPAFTYDMPAEELAIYLAKNGVICSPGTAFGSGGEGHIRFSFATSPEIIEKAMERIEKAVSELDRKG